MKARIFSLALILILPPCLKPEAAPDSPLGFLKNGRYSEAVSACLEIIERNPAEVAVYAWLDQALEPMASAKGMADAIRISERLEDLLRQHPGNAFYHYGLGLIYQKQSQLARAGEHLRKSITLGGRFWEAYEALVNCYQDEGDIRETGDFLRARLQQQPANAFLYQAIGIVHYYSSEYHEAFGSLEKAGALFRERGAKVQEGRSRLNLSDVYTYFNDYHGALREARRGLELSRATGDRLLEAQCLERAAFVWNDLGDDARAFEACRQALAIARGLASRKLEVLSVRTLGVIYLERGDLVRAQDCLSSALAFYRQAGALRSQDICLYWLTLLYKDKGDYSKAMGCAREALRISRQIGFKTGEAFNLTTIGDIYLALGNHDRALEFNKQALSVAERYIGKWSREECLNTIGHVYIELQDYPRALEYFQQALAYIRKIGHRREEARCLHNVALAQLKLGDYPSALAGFSGSLAAARLAGKKVLQAQNANRLGDLYRQQAMWEKSRRAYAEALAAGREIGQPNVVWEAYAGMGALHAARDEFAPAIENYKKAIDVIEDLRVQLLLREDSSGFFNSKVPVYEALVGLLYERYEKSLSAQTLEDCLYYAEKAKARSFLDDLQKARLDFCDLPREKADGLEDISRKISRLSAGLNDASLSPTDRADLRERLERTEHEFQTFVEQARAENPAYSRAAYSEPCRLPEIRQKLLDGKTGIVEYFVGEKHLYVFFISAGDLSAIRLTPPETQRTLRLVSNYVRLLTSKEITNSDILPAGRKLFEALLGAAGRKHLSGLESLIFIPDRMLYYLPFETLVPMDDRDGSREGKRFLFEDYGIAYAPSASTLASILEHRGRTPAEADLLSIGDPVVERPGKGRAGGEDGEDLLFEYYLEKRFVLRRLEFASREMESISRLIAPRFRRLIRHGQATEDLVKTLPLSSYKILHFATHSLLDEKVASRSALVLTAKPNSDEDGFLQAREIYGLRLNADLVVLSACQTAGGKLERGEGIQGLSRAFFCSGSRSVAASLWNVNDESTSHFMAEFYGHLTAGKTKQESLRLTKLSMCRSGSWRPYHWAAFILIGEGDAALPLHRVSFRGKLLQLLRINRANSDSTV